MIRYAVAALLLANTCPDIITPVTLRSTFELRAPIPGTAPFAATSPGAGSVTVDGLFGRPGCSDVSVKAKRDADRVTLQLRLTQRPVPCIDILTPTAYHVVIEGLEAGTYHLRVEHYGTQDVGVIPDFPGGETPVRFQQDVVVS